MISVTIGCFVGEGVALAVVGSGSGTILIVGVNVGGTGMSVTCVGVVGPAHPMMISKTVKQKVNFTLVIRHIPSEGVG